MKNPLAGIDMEKFKHMLETVAARRQDAMEACVKQILSQLLGREPVLEDANQLSLIQLPCKNPMGDITYHVEYGESRAFIGAMVVTNETATFRPVKATGEEPEPARSKVRLPRKLRRQIARKVSLS